MGDKEKKSGAWKTFLSKAGSGESAGGQNGGLVLLVRLVLAAVLFFAGLFVPLEARWKLLLMLISFVVSGYDVVVNGVMRLFSDHVFDEQLMITIAAIAAFVIGAGYEGAAVMLIFRVGLLLRDYAARRTRSCVRDALGLYVDGTVNLIDEQGERTVDVGSIQTGDILALRPGETVLVDCVVTEGSAMVDPSALTGDPGSRRVEAGGLLYSGYVITGGSVKARAGDEAANSVAARALRLTSEETAENGSAQLLIDKIARIYAPFALGVGVLIALVLLIFTDSTVSDAVHRALVLLIVTCPGTLLFSIPVTYFAGLNGALHQGVLIKGAGVMDAVNKAKAVIFEKDGTITTGKYRVVSIKSDRMDPNVLLKVAAHAEAGAHSAMAQSIANAFEGIIDHSIIQDFTESPEGNVTASIDGITIAMGSRSFLLEQGVTLKEEDDGSLSVYMALEGQYAGRIVLADTVRDDASATVLDLEAAGCDSIMLTSDSEDKARGLANSVGVREFRAQCTPLDKIACVREIKDRYPTDTLLYLGDGNSDAAALDEADIGVALNGLTSDGSMESGDVVIMDNEPGKTALAIGAARSTQTIVRQNLILAGAVKFLLLILALLGVTYQLWFASFMDAAVCLACVLNAIRAFSIRSVPIR